MLFAKEHDTQESLLTKKSLALALSPPRAPPIGSAHRELLLGIDPNANAEFTSQNQEETTEEAHSRVSHRNLRKRLYHRFSQNSFNPTSILPHPHLLEASDASLTRFLGVLLPISWQNHCRDSGSFRAIADYAVTLSAPSMALGAPNVARQFVQLTKEKKTLRYGRHKRQIMDLFLPKVKSVKRLIFFVHGGAWGSGLPWMYRLIASPFLKEGFAVAIVGYRTYPEGKVHEQVDDLENAALFLTVNYPDLVRQTTVIGHSSGAHIALMMIVDRAVRSMQANMENDIKTYKPLVVMKVDSFVGLSGPYNISQHFDYEAARGVEELSPMKPVNGYTREAFKINSPAHRLKNSLIKIMECQNTAVENVLPKMALLHGIEDETVPFTATGEAARILRSCGATKCQEIYIPKTGHQDVVMHLMTGGPALVAVMKWLRSIETPSENRPIVLVSTSKL